MSVPPLAALLISLGRASHNLFEIAIEGGKIVVAAEAEDGRDLIPLVDIASSGADAAFVQINAWRFSCQARKTAEKSGFGHCAPFCQLLDG